MQKSPYVRVSAVAVLNLDQFFSGQGRWRLHGDTVYKYSILNTKKPALGGLF